ncbi:hypothetical protein LshimejAT787_0601430 [Lyophyllum shimeji]|uniref:Uncharacterized protein n=1 Tax=Lyophyllum shimeji TaxID=47721 RepID=A0A9P3UQ84_LYOSH|nr:hypothetical protein LshimejAT787_0601430 [Lyophyllum shimeji]
MSLAFPTPTESSLANARRALSATRASVTVTQCQNRSAEAALAQVVRDSKLMIDEMQDERAVLEEQAARTMALALRMPKIWSKIRLLTTQHASADTIRYGSNAQLGLRDALETSATIAHSHAKPSALVVVVCPYPCSFPPRKPPIVLPPSPGGPHDAWLHPHHPGDRHASQSSRSSLHWGYIAIYYLAEQMHRWERFIFRFDKQFTSMPALKSISGEAPLLREFEVSSAEAAFYQEWQWLPNAPQNATLVLPKLRTLTLQYTPFKWSSPMLRTNLHTLNLRALPTSHLPLDRILYIIANNPHLNP